jgi:hypothetical protein
MYEEPLIDFVQKAEPTWEYSKAFTVGKTTHATEKGYVVAGLGLPTIRGNAEPITTEDLSELEDWSATAIEIALGIDWDMKLIEDKERISNLLAVGSRAIAESFKQAVSQQVASVLNYAFDSTNQPLYDTSALCDSVTSDWNVTVDNDLPVATPGYDSIWDMIKFLMFDQRSLKNLKKSGKPMNYIYYPSWVEEVTAAFQNGHIPGTVTRDENQLKRDFNITPVQCIELTDTNAHFMQGTRSKKNFRLRMKKNLTTEWDDHKKNRTRSALSHMVFLRYVMNRDDFVGIPGS